MRQALVVCFAALLLAPFSCKKDAPVAGGASPATPGAGAAGPEAPAPGAAAPETIARPAHPDPGPTLTMKSGKTSRPVADPETIPATGRLVAGGHVYVLAALPEGPDVPAVYSGAPDLGVTVRADVRGDAAGAAAVWMNATPGHRALFVRLAGETLPGSVTVDIAQTHRSQWNEPVEAGWERGRLVVSGVVAAPERPALKSEFFEAFAASMEAWGRVGGWRTRPFYAFATNRARVLNGARANTDADPQRLARTDLGDMMSLYTGALSVEEALQADRGLRLRTLAPEAPSLPIAEIEGVPLPAHPWPDMQKALGKEPVIEALAAHVPADLVYVHFSDLRTAVRLMDDIADWAVPVAQLLDSRPGTNHLVDRYQEQLVVDRIGLAKKIGHLAADGVAFVADDPFLREGSVVGLLFHVKQRALLTSALALYEAAAREKHADLTESTYEIGGKTVRVLSTPDGTVSQHRFDLTDDVLVVTNSRSMVERLVAVAEKRATPLADSGDFRYLRTIYPFQPAGDDPEAGYLFISDAFVANAVGPRAKIGAARRMAAQADLQAVAHAALLFGWLEGRPPKDAGELVASGLLDADELKHADGAPITFDPTRGPSSARWGTLAALRPLSDVPIDLATPAEKAAYDNFRGTYQTYWRSFIDPIAARISRSEDGKRIAVDARMLPLIDGSDYDDLIRTVGQASVTPPDLADGVQWTVAVGEQAEIRQDLDQLGRMLGQTGISFGWLGDWVMIGAAGRSSLWDLALFSRVVPESELRTHPFQMENTGLGIVARLPVYVGAHVRNPLGLAGTLTALRSAAFSAAPGLVDWGEVEPYRDVPIVAIRAKKGMAPSFQDVDKVALYYATAKDVFLASLNRDVLEMQIDTVLDGHVARSAITRGEAPSPGAASVPGTAAAGATGAATGVDLRLSLDEPDGWLARAALGLLEHDVRTSLESAHLDLEALARGRGGLPQDPAALRALAMGWLGYEPQSVQGGAFTLGEDGLIRHSIYGSPAEPVFPAIPQEGALLTTLIRTLRSAATNVSFEGKGRTHGLHARFEWSRR